MLLHSCKNTYCQYILPIKSHLCIYLSTVCFIYKETVFNSHTLILLLYRFLLPGLETPTGSLTSIPAIAGEPDCRPPPIKAPWDSMTKANHHVRPRLGLFRLRSLTHRVLPRAGARNPYSRPDHAQCMGPPWLGHSRHLVAFRRSGRQGRPAYPSHFNSSMCPLQRTWPTWLAGRFVRGRILTELVAPPGKISSERIPGGQDPNNLPEPIMHTSDHSP